MDPHLYFEQKITRSVMEADSIDELLGMMRNLFDWVDQMGIQSSQMARLDTMLSTEGLPDCAMMRTADDQEVMRALARGS